MSVPPQATPPTFPVGYGPAPARYVEGGPHLSRQRARVLDDLQLARAAVTVEETATRLALHTNTARNHLEALVEVGLATREQAPVVGRGRPAWCYKAAEGHPEPDVRVRDYAGLATALAEQISRTSADPAGDALAAGQAWGRSLVEDQPVGTAAQARRRVVELFDRLGFAPETGRSSATVRLLRCPLLDAARANPEVVCNVHLGIARGALAALGGDPEPSSLEAFAEPGACRLNLGLRSQKERSTTERTSRP